MSYNDSSGISAISEIPEIANYGSVGVVAVRSIEGDGFSNIGGFCGFNEDGNWRSIQDRFSSSCCASSTIIVSNG